jgi:hypothetical protein
MDKQVVRIERPIVMVYEDGGATIFRIHKTEKTHSHKQFGMLVCDLVRHVAKALDVDEADVWSCVQQERDFPTTSIKQHS